MKAIQKINKWGLLWKHAKQQKPKEPEHLMFNAGKLLLFNTRSSAREYANEKYGYIKVRNDLRTSPHYWRFPVAVRITGIIFNLK